MKNLWRRLLNLPSRLNLREKIIALVLILALVFLAGSKIKNFVYNRLILMPTYGGTYTEGIVGQPKLLTPISTLDNNDRTILSLLFVGLTETTADGRTLPVLADSWVISEDAKSYTFVLKPDLKWHDGKPLTTSDIAETIKQVVDPDTKSPYLADWDGVTVEVKDERTISFHLESPSAPFLAATDLPIVPMHISAVELQQSLIGNGPYKFADSKSKENTILEVKLASNDWWIGGKPYIDNVVFRFFSDQNSLFNAYKSGDIDSVVEWSNDTSELGGQQFNLPTQRHRLLFFNTARDNIRELSIRQKLVKGERVENVGLKIITHQNLADHPGLQQQIKDWQNNGVNVTLETLDSLALLDKIDAHDYDALFADIDMRADMDLYPLWHSSQRGAGGYNFAQLDDQEIDKKLEEARTNIDLNKRRNLTDEVSKRLQDLATYKDIEQVTAVWHVQDRILGIPKMEYVVDSPDRFADVTHWYIKTKHRTLRNIDKQ